MTVGLDSSFVLRLLTGMPEALAEAALHEVQERLSRGDTMLVCDLVVSEVYFALQHHYGMPKGEAIDLLAGFVQEKGIRCLGGSASVLRTPGLASANPGLVDLTCTPERGTFSKRVQRGTTCTRRTHDEGQAVHRGADHWGTQGGRDGHTGGRSATKARHQPGDTVPLEGEVRRDGGQ